MSGKTGVNQKREALIDCFILLHTSNSQPWKNKEENTERHYALDVLPLMAGCQCGRINACRTAQKHFNIVCSWLFSLFEKKEKINRHPYLI